MKYAFDTVRVATVARKRQFCSLPLPKLISRRYHTPISHQPNEYSGGFCRENTSQSPAQCWGKKILCGETHGGLAAHSLLSSGTPTIPNVGQSTAGEAHGVEAHHPGRGQTIPAGACLLEPHHPGPHRRRSPSPFPAPRAQGCCPSSEGSGPRLPAALPSLGSKPRFHFACKQRKGKW